MLVIAGHVRIDPSARDRAISAAIEMMEDTRKEPGCISYIFSADLGDPGVFRIFEEWESPEALDHHFRTPHMARFQTAIGELGVKEMDVKRYEIASTGPIGG